MSKMDSNSRKIRSYLSNNSDFPSMNDYMRSGFEMKSNTELIPIIKINKLSFIEA